MMIINFLKDLVKTTMRKVLITATLMIIDFMLFLLTSTAKITMKTYTLQSHQVKHYILKTPSNRNFRELNSERGKRVVVIRREQYSCYKTLQWRWDEVIHRARNIKSSRAYCPALWCQHLVAKHQWSWHCAEKL